MKKIFKVLIFPVLLVAGSIRLVFSYIGPGSGLSALGALLAILAGVLTTIFGFIWYPIKRLLKKNKEPKDPGSGTDEEDK